MEPVKISLSGFDERSTNRLKNIFLINYRGKCVLSPPALASVTLVDIDSFSDDITHLLGSLDPARTILLGTHRPPGERFVFLAKPARLDLLWQAISGSSTSTRPGTPAAGYSVAQSLGEHFATRAAIESTSVRRVGQSNHYRPDDYFISDLTNILDSNPPDAILRIITWDEKQILMCRSKNILFTDLGKNQFRALAATPLAANLRERITWHSLDLLPSSNELEKMNRLNLMRTVWELAWHTSRGRTPEALDQSQKYQLLRWPNFTRLPPMSNGMRIAAVWAREPQRLDDIAAYLNIEPAEVYAFYAAASAAGLCTLAASQQQGIAGQRPAQAAPRRLFRSLLAHINTLLKPQDEQLWSQERQV